MCRVMFLIRTLAARTFSPDRATLIPRARQEPLHGRGHGIGPHRQLRRILVLNWRDPWHPEAGGAEVMLHEHVKRWARQGYQITLYTARYAGALREEVRDGIRIVRAGGRFTIYLWAPILYWRKLRSEADAVLDIENGIPFFTPLYSRKPRICLVHHVHRDQFLWEFGPVLGRVGRFVECRLMPAIYARTPFIAVSESTRRELARIGVPVARCRVIHNGLDHEAYRPVVEKSPTPRLIYVGRLKRHKRVDLILDLCARMRNVVSGLVLDIAGTGDDEQRLRALVAKRGLEDVVRFHGFVSHPVKVALYSHAWAFITTTEREGWGLSIMEAAACGTPTVCLDVPGVRDAVDSGTSGVLASDMDELYHASALLLSDDEWRQSLSTGASHRSREFSWDTSAAGMLAAFTDVCLHGTLRERRPDQAGAIRAHLMLSIQASVEIEREEVVRTISGHVRAGDFVDYDRGTVHVHVAIQGYSVVDGIEDRLRRVLTSLPGADGQHGGSPPGLGLVTSHG